MFLCFSSLQSPPSSWKGCKLPALPTAHPIAGNAPGPPSARSPRAEIPTLGQHLYNTAAELALCKLTPLISLGCIPQKKLKKKKTRRKESSDHFPLPLLLCQGDLRAQSGCSETASSPRLLSLHPLTKTDPSHKQRVYSSANVDWDARVTPASLLFM